MGTPREPFLKKGDRVLHRLSDREGTVQAVSYRLDADRAHVQFDDGTDGEFASAELTLRRQVVMVTNPHRQDVGDPVNTTTLQKSCNNCQNRCMDMDMDPYCAAVNRPWGQVLYSGIPKECGPSLTLWQIDTRGKK